MHKILLSIFLIAILDLSTVVPCVAQFGTVSKTSPKYKEKSRLPEAETKEIKLPDIPVFPGAKFISAQEAGKKAAGVSSSYTLQYLIPQASELQVVPFYAGIFGGDWNIAQKGERCITAINEKTNTRCSITVGTYNQFYSNINVIYTVTAPSD